jgi:tetratricopeptide (TPR) repeat protein
MKQFKKSMRVAIFFYLALLSDIAWSTEPFLHSSPDNIQSPNAQNSNREIQGARQLRQNTPIAGSESLALGIKSLALGEYSQADMHFNRAINYADSKEEKAQLKILWANAISKTARYTKGEEAQNLYNKARELYSTALDNVSGDQRLKAYNNYGSLLMRKGQPAEALKVLSSIESDYDKSIDTLSRAQYLYNLARALEINGNIKKAIKKYQKAVAVNPRFKPANRAVFRLLLNQSGNFETISASVMWLNQSIEYEHIDLVETNLQSIYRKTSWVKQPNFDRIFEPQVSYFTMTKLTTEVFKDNWEKNLAEIKDASSTTEKIVKEIIAAYRGEYPVNFEPDSGANFFRMSIRRAIKNRIILSKWLKVIGDNFLREKDANMALQRYTAAWTIDTTYVPAALSVANVLLEWHDDVDPDGKLLSELIFALFEGKSGAYLGGDWENILRFHTVLGTIFEKQGKWGSNWDPKSAIFQWEHAIKAYESLEKQTQVWIDPVPGIYINLAKAYEATNRYKDAFDSYLAGGWQAARIGNIEIAKEAVTKAELVSHNLKPNTYSRDRLDRLNKKIKSM